MKTLACFLSMLVICGFCATAPHADSSKKTRARKPTVAGQFYPSDPEKLARAVDCYLEDAVTPFQDRPIAIVCPHAGYTYSGQIAADAYRQASKHAYDLVVILGVNHTTAGFEDVSIYAEGGFETPLGVAAIDEELANTLIASDKDFTFHEGVHAREHSIEVQVPFIQRIFPQAKILPVIVGAADPDLCTRFGKALAGAIKGRRTLIVASCDLSHFPDYEDAVRVDRKTLEALGTLDPKLFRSVTSEQLREGTPNLGTCACGEPSVLTAMVAARQLGATGAEIVSYANSGDTSLGDRSRVVGYGAVAFVAGSSSSNLPTREERKAEGEDETLFTQNQKSSLLSFARKTVRQYLTTQTTPLPRGFDPTVQLEKGAFVTLRRRGELRGCIGHMKGDLPLCQAVGYCALQAAFNDRRFSPVELDELSDVEIEISVLTPYRLVDGYRAIEIGRDGILMEKNGRSAVFLPSVPVEQGWNREETLSHLSTKAGLPSNAWKEGARFYTFQAIAFSETDPE